jgi:hypothetical protein
MQWDFTFTVFTILAIIFFILFIIFVLAWLYKRHKDNEKRHAKDRISEQVQYKGRMSIAQGRRPSGTCPNCGANTGGMMRCPSCGEYN